MPRSRLTCFDFDGSRGEAARLAMHLAGIAFEDKRIARSDWPALRDQMPYQAMPILEADGKVIAQSNTINRYVGKLADDYPKDDWQAAVVDELMDAVEDIIGQDRRHLRAQRRVKEKSARGAGGGSIPRFLKQFQARLKEGGSEWFVEKRLTVADLKCFVFVRWLKSGVLDHMPADLGTSTRRSW